MRLVLDTNVWLDWFLFEDQAIDPIKSAWQYDRVEIVIDPCCRDELVRVLAYPKFDLDRDTQTNIIEQTDTITRLLCGLDYGQTEQLPFCKDPDDIKFLALAAASQADWLITKDNALLSALRRKKAAAVAGYRIGTPEHWMHASFSP